MARNKTQTGKRRLSKLGRQTKWAPFWVIPKTYGKGKRVHPSRLTRVKRTWRRTNIKTRIKANKLRNIKSGYKRKKI